MRNKKCKFCGKIIKGIFKSIKTFCNLDCKFKYENKIKLNRLKIELNRLKKLYLIKENVSTDISEKYFKMTEFTHSKEDLMNLINGWKNIQDSRIRIINCKTWYVQSNYLNQCEPWQAKITYTFDIMED